MRLRLIQIFLSNTKTVFFRLKPDAAVRTTSPQTIYMTLAITLTLLLSAAIPIFAQDTNSSPQQSEAANKVFLPLISSSSPGATPPPTPSTGKSITGMVYYDTNTNGRRELDSTGLGLSIEQGVGGVTVTALDNNGSQCGQAITSSEPGNLGNYVLTHTCASTKVHVEFGGLPNGFEGTPSESVAAANSQFVDAAATNVDYGIYRPSNFCQGTPQVAISTLQSNQNGNASSISLFFTADLQGNAAINSSGSNPSLLPQTTLASQSQIGDVYGLAYHKATRTLFASAFVKSSSKPASVALPNGAGVIYQIPPNGRAITPFTIIPDVGNVSGANGTIAQNDVGNVGLGDIELSEDGSTLYAINIGAKQLMVIKLQESPLAVASVKAQKLAQPSDCAVEQTHPFGLGVNNGKVYVGMVCGGPTNNDLKAYVYESNGLLFSKKLSFPLTYERATANTLLSPDGNNLHTFTNWATTPAKNANANTLAAVAKTAPWLTDIAFDGGDMILGFRSRWVDQIGDAATTVGGEVLRACGNAGYVSTAWSLEKNGVCGGKSTNNPPPAIDPWTGGSHALENSKGPGGFEYYWGDDGFEGESIQGGLLQLQGASHVFATQSGVLGHGRQLGVVAMNNTTGAISAAGNIGSTGTGLNSTGDMEFICDLPPVEIGNRVWNDSNANGIQDAGEPGVANLTLELYDDNALIATAVTDENGNYLFRSDANGDPNPNDSIGLVPGRIDLSRGFSVGGSGYQIRIPNIMGPIRQMALRSNPVEVTSSSEQEVEIVDEAAAITLATTQNYTNHNCDFGLVTAIVGQNAYCSADLANTTAMLKKYNVIVLDDLSTSSQVEGRTFIGNNLTSSAAADFATHLAGFVDATDNTLVIAGNTVPGNALNLQAGSVRVGGSTNGRTINLNGGGAFVTDSSLSDASMTMQLQNASLGLAALTPNNNATLASASNNIVGFNVATVNGCGIAIFNVDAAALFNNTQASQITLNPGAATTIIINVSGSSINWSNAASLAGKFADSTWRGRVLWNFHQAISFNAGSHTLMGAVLAPFASVATHANIEGSIAARSLTTSAQVNQPEFTGDLSCACTNPTPTPTPVPPTPTPTYTPTPTAMPTATPTLPPPAGMGGNSVLTITKQVVGNGNGPFNITIAGSTGYLYNTSISPSASVVLTGLERGVYTVTEASPGVGWTTYYTAAPGFGSSNNAVVTLGSSTAPLSGISITGKVYQDYNSDGAITSNSTVVDNGVSGVSVAAYDPKGLLAGTATTDNNGNYTLTPNKAGPYRVEFTNLPAGFEPTTHGTQNGTSTQFVTNASGASNVNLGINRPCDYCQNNPSLATTRLTAAAFSGYGSKPGVVTFNTSDVNRAAQPFLLGAYNTNQWAYVSSMSSLQTVASQAAVGNVFGLTWRSASKTIFSSAFARSNLMSNGGLGSGGLGAIYATNLNGSPSTSLFATVSNVGTFGYGENDKTGAVGLGDLELSEDQNTLYATNLYAKTLVKISLYGTTPTAGAITQIALPVPSSCPAASLHPFALASYANKLYVGMTCDGNSGTAMGYVYEYNGVNFTQKLNFSFNYARPNTFANRYGQGSWGEFIDNNLNFIAWNVYPNNFAFSDYEYTAKTQPWLVGITFDKGDMILGIRSRLGDARGDSYEGGHEWTTGGDLLRACANNAYNPTTWTFENNGFCGSKTTQPIPTTDPYTGRGSMNSVTMGPGGKSYFWGNIGYEGKPSQGGVAQIPGYKNLYAVSIDAMSHMSEQGIMAISHSSGAISAAGNVFYGSDYDGIFKGNALGDIEALCDPAPIEIGNRVWDDFNGNGIQDPGEPGLNGVTVVLQASAGAPQTTVTSVDGNYYFNNLNPNTVYAITINPSQAALVGYGVTKSNLQAISGSATSNNALLDTRDNDATLLSGVATINYTTGSLGQNNHSLDFGFVKPMTGDVMIRNIAPAPVPASIGNRVWADNNGNGIQDGGEPGVFNLEVKLYQDNSGAGQANTLLSSTTTNGDGSYAFTNLDASLRYKLHFVLPSGHLFTLKDAVGSTEFNDSDAYPNGDTDMIMLTPGANAEVGAGIYALSTIGNRVWEDLNSNGIQDGGEPGITSLEVQLYQDNSANNSPNTLLTSTQTTANGNYAFTGLNPFIAYNVHFALIANHTFTIKDAAGSTELNDSDAYPNGNTDKIVLAPGANAEVGAGLIVPGSIGNRVWEDTNGNGIQDGGEPGVPALTVTLYQDNSNISQPNTFLASTTTSGDGLYSFTNLNTSISYKVHFQLIADHSFTIKDAAGGTEMNDSDAYPNGDSDTIVLTAGTNAEVGAGLIALAAACTIGDRVWYDLDGNGIQDVGEGNVSGIKIDLYADTLCTSNLITSTTSDSNGAYHFDTLPMGDYCMLFSNIPGSWYLSPKNAGDDAVDSDPSPQSGNFAILSVLQSNMVCKDSTKDLGLWAAGKITQKVWCEGSNPVNSTFDAASGDVAKPDVTMSIYKDTGCDGTPDAGAIGTGVTDATGDFTFENLPVAFSETAGQRTCYVVTVDTSDPDLAGCANLSGGSSTMFELSTDRINTNAQYVTGSGFAFRP